MVPGTVVKEEIDVGQIVIRGFQKYHSITVAFWMLLPEQTSRFLYLACEDFNNGAKMEAYSHLIEVAHPLWSRFFEPSQVRLIGATDSIAQAALARRQKETDPWGTLMRNEWLADERTEEVYIYPASILEPAAVA